MSQNQQDKRTKSQILRLLDHAMQQEEKLAEKIQTLENQLTECQKRAEDPRYEITESAIPASKVSFRLDYYRTEKKGPVRGIIEHLSSRESKSFGSEDGFDTIQQFVGKYLPVKARNKEKPIAPPSPFLEKTPTAVAAEQPEAAAEMEAPLVATVLENEQPAEAAPMQPAEVEAQPVATVLENEQPAEAAPVQLAEVEAQPVATVLGNEPANDPAAAPETSESNLRQLSQTDLFADSLGTSERLAARIRRSLSLPAEPEQVLPQPTIEAPGSAAEILVSQRQRSQQSAPVGTPLVANERLAARIRRSLSLPASSEPEEMPETTFRLPMATEAAAVKKSGGEAAVFSVVADGSDQHQTALQSDQHFQVEIPTTQLPEIQGKSCHARLLAVNLETGEQVRAADSCQPGPSALRFPKRPLQLPPGGYRLTAVLGLAADPRTIFYRESRLVVVK